MDFNSLLDRGLLVLTASRRLAHAMRLRYAQHAQSQGRAVWKSPQILPWTAWLRQQWLEARALGAYAVDARLLTTAQTRLLWDDIVTNSESGQALLVPANAARLASRSWQRLHEYLIPLARIRESDAPEAQALHDWCAQFARRCADLRAIDDARIAQWMHEVNFIPAQPLALAGFDMLPPAIARLIARWRTQGRVVEPDPQAGPAQTIAQTIVVIAAPDVQSELEYAARWAREQVERATGSVGIIVTDLQSRREEARRVFEDVFAPGLRHTLATPASAPVVIAAPAPLASYPLIDAALLVLSLSSGDNDSIAAGRLLRSPFIVGGESERARRALADLRLRHEQRDRWNWSELERWAGITGCDRLQLAARSLAESTRNPATRMPSEWAERFQAQLAGIGWPGERTLNSVEHQTLAKFHDALAQFGSLDTVTRRCDAGQALAHFRALLQDTPFEPETAQGAVIVIDATTSAGMSFDSLWIAGLQADRLPAPANPDVLIPLELQREFHLPEATVSGGLQLATLQVERWLRSGTTLTFSWPQRDGDVELSMSPLLSRFSQGQPSPPEPVLTLRRAIFEQRPEFALLRDERAPPFVGEAVPGGSAVVGLQSRCEFRAQGELRLKARALPRVSLGVEPTERGSILHEVLEEIWGGLRSQQALLALTSQELECVVRDSVQRVTAATLRPDTRVHQRLAALEVESAMRRVLQLLALEKRRPAFTVRFAEASERFAIGGLQMTLRPDRIDELAEGGELLIDYKLGDSHRPRDWLDTLPGRPRQPQLPLYGLAHGERLRALAFVILAAGTVEYRGLSDGANVGEGVKKYPARKPNFGDPYDWVALQHHWQFTLTRLAERFVAGEASVNPLSGECDYCHLQALCRIHESIYEPTPEIDDE